MNLISDIIVRSRQTVNFRRDKIWRCNCDEYVIFANAIAKLIREINSVHNEESNWKKFQEFRNQFLSQKPQTICILDHIYNLVMSCERKVFSRLQNMCKQNKIKLFTLLLNTFIFHYSEIQCFDCGSFLHYLENDKRFGNGVETSLVLNALNGCRSELLKFLLNFDLIRKLEGDKSNLGNPTMKIIEDFILNDDDSNLHDNKFKAVQAIKLCIDIFFRGSYHEKLRRIYLATLAIRATRFKIKKEEEKAKKCIHCLRMYFAAIREPLITINEVRYMIYAYLIVLKNSLRFEIKPLQAEHYELLEKYSEEFAKLMPECPVKIEPRKLTDLVRFHIRKNLKRCHPLPLPEAVRTLNLPELLQEVVIGDVIDMPPKNDIFPEQVVTISQLAGLLSKRPRFVLSNEFL